MLLTGVLLLVDLSLGGEKLLDLVLVFLKEGASAASAFSLDNLSGLISTLDWLLLCLGGGFTLLCFICSGVLSPNTLRSSCDSKDEDLSLCFFLFSFLLSGFLTSGDLGSELDLEDDLEYDLEKDLDLVLGLEFAFKGDILPGLDLELDLDLVLVLDLCLDLRGVFWLDNDLDLVLVFDLCLDLDLSFCS